MTNEQKPIDTLTTNDLATHRIWEYTDGPTGDETWIRPVKGARVASLTGKFVATRITLENGERPWAMIGNVDLGNAKLTKHFLTVSVEHNGRWFHLARYHDHDYADRGPQQLANFLGTSIAAVFPISYDISNEVGRESEAAKGSIVADPEEKLTRAEIIALAVP
jgi:hypothetical protein